MADTSRVVTPTERWQRRWAELDNGFASWRTRYAEIARFVWPFGWRDTTTARNRDADKLRDIIDNTPVLGIGTLAAGLQSGATSPARPWFALRASDPRVRKVKATSLWLDDATREVQDAMARSNVYRGLHTIYQNLGGYGTGVGILEEHPTALVQLRVIPTGEYRLATNWNDEVDTLYRQFRTTVGAVVRRFGETAVSETVRDAYRNGHHEREVTIMQVIEPREGGVTGHAEAARRPWTNVYLELGGNAHTHGGAAPGVWHVLHEGGYDFFPVVAPRWTRPDGDVYGHGPGHVMLGDSKQLQHQQSKKALAIDLHVEPALRAPSSLRGQDIERLPGGITYSDESFERLVPVDIDLSALLVDIQDVRTRIDRACFRDLFQMLQLSDSGRMTAREVAERHEEKLTALGPMLEALDTELLRPLVMHVFRRLIEAGRIPPPPPELRGVDLGVEFTSVLAQAQRVSQVVAIERAAGVIGIVASLDPSAVDNFDGDGAALAAMESIGVPAAVVRDPKARDALRAARAQAQAAEAQAKLMQDAAASSRDFATAAQVASAPGVRDVLSRFTGINQPPAQAL